MGRWFYACVLVSFVSAKAWAGALALGPYLVDPRPDGVTVQWETETAQPGALVVEAPGGERRFESPASLHHTVRATGLPPGRFPYRIVDGKGTTLAAASLATAATSGEVVFLVYGDTRDDVGAHGRTVAAAVKEGADFVLHLGDLVADGAVAAEWRDFFRIEAPLLHSTPVYPALGNHELVGDAPGARWLGYFGALASAGSATPRTYYSFRHGGSLFLSLDGNHVDDPKQTEWLERTLAQAAADAATTHVFVFLHQAPLSVGMFCGDTAQQRAWVPLFERYHVTAVFAGHEHHYKRLERAGVRYFVSGGGGAPLLSQRPACAAVNTDALRRFELEYHYLRVRVRGRRVDVEALTPAGALVDSHAIVDDRTALRASRGMLQAALLRARR